MKIRLLSILCLTFFCSPCDGKGRGREVSWGKPNVSYAEYKSDSIECAKIGYLRDVSKDEPAKRFLRGFRTADEAINQADMGGANIDKWRDSILLTQPSRRLKEVHNIQLSDVEKCLMQKGYSQFILNEAQQRTLKKYPIGTEARRRYLYSLASQQQK